MIPSFARYSVPFALNFLWVEWLFRQARTIYPNTGDEHSLLFQARIFASFKLAAKTPPLKEFFQSHWIAFHGDRWFSIYPPGQPLLLTPGVLMGWDTLMPALLSSTCLLLLYFLALRLGQSRLVAFLAAFFLGIAPTFAFHSASYLTHVSTLTIYLCSAHLWISFRRSGRLQDAVGFGLVSAFGLLIRPYTFFLLLLPTALCAAFLLARRQISLKTFISSVTASIFVLFLGYLFTVYLSGSVFDSTYVAQSLFGWAFLNAEGVARSWGMLSRTLDWFLPVGGLLLPVVALGVWASRKNNAEMHFLAGACALFLGHMMVKTTGGRFGERYYFETLAAVSYFLAVGIANLLDRIRREELRIGVFFVLITVALISNLDFIIDRMRFYRLDNQARMEPFTKVERMGLKDSIIFVRSVPVFSPTFYTRNKPDLSGNLFVLDRGPENDVFLKRFPNRQAFCFENESGLKAGKCSL